GRVLIILDNFEQVVDHAPTVGRWLAGAPEAQFIVTSRARLGIEGERVLLLDPLLHSDAIELFESRAKAATNFQVDQSNRAIVADIAKQVDCIPLALELAAARTRMLSPDQIRQRLAARFRLLIGGPTSRQRTLWAMIDWSWQLLKPLERHALAQCSVFRRGFTVETAEEVLDFSVWPDEPWTLDVLGSLVDQCLLRKVETPAGQARFRLLESIREFAAQKMEQTGAVLAPHGDTSLTGLDQRKELGLRHARHFSDLAAVAYQDATLLRGGREVQLALAAEVENLRAAFDFTSENGYSTMATRCALAIGRHFRAHGPISASLAVFHRAADLPDLDKTTLGKLLSELGFLCLAHGDNDEAEQHLITALAVARKEGSQRLEGNVLHTLGFLACTRGQLEEARTHYQSSLQIHRNLANHYKVGRAFGMLGCVARMAGRLDEAHSLLDEALSIQRRVGDRAGEMYTLADQANLCQDRGRIDQARRRFNEAVAGARELGEKPVEASVLNDLADLEMRNGHFDDARHHFDAAITLAREVGYRNMECVSLGNLGELYQRQGQLDEAESHLQRAIELADARSHRLPAGAFRGTLALCRAQREDFTSARELLARGEEHLQNYPQELGILLCKAVQVERLANNTDGANKILA
ncbi:MAG: tetratricopeptide repeat protein, partial [Proteobacteria bacterium]|nr:tetratricopeptide repeat protein [Pseudomonadota bacterium]